MFAVDDDNGGANYYYFDLLRHVTRLIVRCPLIEIFATIPLKYKNQFLLVEIYSMQAIFLK